MRLPELDGGQPRQQSLVPRRPVDPLADPVIPRYQAYDSPADYVTHDTPGVLVEYWNLIRRHKGAVLAIGLLGVITAVALTLPQVPVYQARTSIEIEALNDNFLNMKSVDPTSALPDYSGEGYIQTQIKILQSNSLMARVVKVLKGDDTAAPLKPSTGWTASLRRALHLPVPEHGSPQLQALAGAAGSLQVHVANNTHIVEITCDSTDPKLASDFANTLVKEYIEYNLESRWKTTQYTGDWLKLQLQDLKVKLEQSERELQNYASSAGLTFTSNEKGSVAEDKLRQLQQEISKAQAERVLQQTKYETAASKPPESLPEILDDPMLRESQTRLTDLRRQYAELSSSLTPEHYRVQRIQAQITELESALDKRRSAVLKRIRNDYESAQRRERLLMDEYVTQNRVVGEQSARGIRYDTLKREVDTNRQLYEALLQRVKEAGITAAMRASNISVVDPAMPPTFPYKPNLLSNSAVGLLAGLMLGIGFVIMRERADRSIQAPGETAQYLNLLELGVIPSAKIDANQMRLNRDHPEGLIPANGTGLSERVELVTLQHRSSMLAESFRAALASILFGGQKDTGTPVIVLTSASPSEGKTMIATNLAVAMAETHRKVLLIDADLRKPRVHNVFGLPNTAGLSDLLKRSDPLTEFVVEEAPRSTDIPGLDVLTSGPGTANLSNLLYSSRLPELLRILRQNYDAVLIDTPPMLQMPDARILARQSDGVILVLRAGRTTRDTAIIAKKRFTDDGTPILGTILNDWNAKARNSYGYQQYYKGYYEYHGNGEKSS